MSDLHVTVSRVIDAPADAIYAILADYERGHPSILPKPYFKELVVEQGGRGAGTVARVAMEVMGSRQTFRLRVTEPVPGRELVEEDEARGAITRFTLEPLPDDRTHVTIDTRMRPSGGLRGLMERWMNPPITRRIYAQELELLAAAASRAAGPAPV